MQSHNQHLFVVRAIENPDVAAFRQDLGVAPEIVVVELFGRRRFEARDAAALRIDADITCLMAPSFPAASIACKLISKA
jgi:hypothetical protein